MKLRIVHEPWEVAQPYVIEEEGGELGGFNMTVPNHTRTEKWYFRTRHSSEEEARTWVTAYMRGPQVIAEFTSEPAAPSAPPGARP